MFSLKREILLEGLLSKGGGRVLESIMRDGYADLTSFSARNLLHYHLSSESSNAWVCLGFRGSLGGHSHPSPFFLRFCFISKEFLFRVFFSRFSLNIVSRFLFFSFLVREPRLAH